jgi:hypothetical protein
MTSVFLFILPPWYVSGLSLHLGDEDLHVRQQPDAIERNNHRVVKVPGDADGGVRFPLQSRRR